MKLTARQAKSSMWLIVAAMMGWWMASEPPTTPMLVGAADKSWGLSELPRRPDLTALAGRVLGAGYWGVEAVAAPASVPTEDVRWRVAATFGNDDARMLKVIYYNPAKPSVNLRVGDSLPNGHRISEIGKDTYGIQINKQTYRIGVEQLEP